MTVEDMYSMAEDSQIGIYAFDLGDEMPALSVQHPDWSCDIALDMDHVDDTATEAALLSHELGHCMTGSFYDETSPFDIRQRHENRADRWAIKTMLPYEDILSAMRSGCTECWQLASHFDVTEEFIRKAYDYYTGPCGLCFM
jgi:hypothetical protein